MTSDASAPAAFLPRRSWINGVGRTASRHVFSLTNLAQLGNVRVLSRGKWEAPRAAFYVVIVLVVVLAIVATLHKLGVFARLGKKP